MATPRLRAAPPGMPRGSRLGTTAELAAASGLPLLLEDLRDLPLVRVEQVVVHLRPPAELADVEEPGGIRVLLLVHQALHHRAISLGGEDLLRAVRAQEVDEGLGPL